MRRPLTQDGSILRSKCERVTTFDKALASLVADMWDTLEAEHGAGLAAPQVGELRRVLVAQYKGRRLALVNPTILKAKAPYRKDWEECLSLPGMRALVERAESIVVSAKTPTGKATVVSATGMLARILQHEIDHLNGVLITDVGSYQAAPH